MIAVVQQAAGLQEKGQGRRVLCRCPPVSRTAGAVQEKERQGRCKRGEDRGDVQRASVGG
jgi:hypothetical protein